MHTQALGLVLAQFDGLVAGYHMRHSVDPVAIPFMSGRDFVFLNGNGELYDLIARQPQMPDLAKMAPHELYVHVALAGRCSGLITVSRAPACSCGLLLLHSGTPGPTSLCLILRQDVRCSAHCIQFTARSTCVTLHIPASATDHC